MSFRIVFYGVCLVIAVALIYVIIISTNSSREEQRLLANRVEGLCDQDVRNLTISYYDTNQNKDVIIKIDEVEDINHFCLASKTVDTVSFQKARHIFRLHLEVNYYSGRSAVMKGRIRNQNNLFLSDLNSDHISVRIEHLGSWFLKQIQKYGRKATASSKPDV